MPCLACLLVRLALAQVASLSGGRRAISSCFFFLFGLLCFVCLLAKFIWESNRYQVAIDADVHIFCRSDLYYTAPGLLSLNTQGLALFVAGLKALLRLRAAQPVCPRDSATSSCCVLCLFSLGCYDTREPDTRQVLEHGRVTRGDTKL